MSYKVWRHHCGVCFQITHPTNRPKKFSFYCSFIAPNLSGIHQFLFRTLWLHYLTPCALSLLEYKIINSLYIKISMNFFASISFLVLTYCRWRRQMMNWQLTRVCHIHSHGSPWVCTVPIYGAWIQSDSFMSCWKEICHCVQEMLDKTIKISAEIVHMGLLQVPVSCRLLLYALYSDCSTGLTLEWHPIRILMQLLAMFLARHPNHQLVFMWIWQIDPSYLTTAFHNFYEENPLNITQILDVAQDLKVSSSFYRLFHRQWLFAYRFLVHCLKSSHLPLHWMWLYWLCNANIWIWING